MEKTVKSDREPTIVRLMQKEHGGMVLHRQNRDAVGYIMNGTKYFYDGDRRKEAKSGEMFYLPKGYKYIENMPNGEEPYEEIVFYYSSEEMSDIITGLHARGCVEIENEHSCDNCNKSGGISCATWSSVRVFFESTNRFFKTRLFTENPISETFKLHELVFLILSNNKCCIKSKLLETLDVKTESFEETVHRNIFNKMTIEELAQKCNMSLTTFKKEFRRRFHDSPHRWYTRQRLMHARLLLLSTSDTIASIGEECNFSNTSHFIKLFSKEFGHTPATYRRKYGRNQEEHTVEELVKTDFKI